MKAKDLQAEIEESLTRGYLLLAESHRDQDPATFNRADVLDMLRAQAANLAQGLAWRTLTEDIAATAQELASTAPKTLALWVAKDVREGLGEE